MKKTGLISLLIFGCCKFGYNQVNQSLSFRPELLAKDNNEACALGDINKDGLLDIVAGRMWYPAPHFIPQPVRPLKTHPPDYANNNGEYLWDVDQDGWLDVITTGWAETRIMWYQNPGKVALEKGLPWKEKSLVDTKINAIEAGYLLDLNQDGQPEYIINSWNQRIPFTVWQFSKDEDGEPILVPHTIGLQNSHGVGFGDLNADGKMDILFDNGWYEQPESQPFQQHWKLHPDWAIERGSCPMQVMDVNGDGRKDVIWGKGHGYGLYWLEQGVPIGDSTTWTKHQIDTTWSQVHAMTLVDLDGNGSKGLITGKRIYAHSGKDPGAYDPPAVYFYRWNIAKQKFDRQTIAIGQIGTGLFIRVADLNQDEKLDIVVAGKTGTAILWQE